MELVLPFGGHLERVDLKGLGGNLRIELSSQGGYFHSKCPRLLSKNELTRKALEGLNCHRKLFDNKKVLTIVNDGFRRTPTDVLLPIVWDLVKDGDFIVATGNHRRPTEQELKRIFGRLFDKVEPRLFIHDCNDRPSLVSVGRTVSGTPVQLNKKVVEADVIFAINSVEPHFFAGFSGGRKSIVPGLASFETIQANHRLAKDENSTTLNLKTNPLNRDLEEAVDLLKGKSILSVQVVINREGKIIDLFAGKMNETFSEACECAMRFYTVDIPKKFKIVIANCEPPFDANLYQLQKAQDHGGRMVENGGILIVMGACKEGVGSEHFMKLAEKYPSPESALDRGLSDDSFGIHKLIKTARQLRHIKIYYVTALNGKLVEKVYFKAFYNIKSALESALSELGGDSEVAVLEDAGFTVPVLRRCRK